MGRKVFAVFMALIMVVAMLPGTVLAASEPILVVGDATVNPGESGSVTVTVENNTGFDSVSFLVTATEGVSIDSVSTTDGILSGWSANYYNGYFSAYTLNTAVQTDGVICTINFTASESASGEFDISLNVDDQAVGTLVLNNTAVEGVTFAPGTITVGSAVQPIADGYSASIDASASSVAQQETVTVNVTVAADENKEGFSSAELVLSYDDSKLRYESITCAQDGGDKDVDVAAKAENDKITVKDYGTHINAAATGTVVYTLTFTAIDGGETNVTLDSAYFSTLSHAETADLIKATVAEADKSETIDVLHNVILPTGDHKFTSNVPNVAQDGSVEITPVDPYYTYVLTATGGTLSGMDENGKWTVSNVTDDVTITVTSAIPFKYNVTVNMVDGEETPIESDSQTTNNGATHDTPYSYTLPDDVSASTVAGTQYTLKSIYIGATEYKDYTTSGRTYTIDGEAIIDDIVITVEKKALDPNAFTVTKDGTGAADGTLAADQVVKDGNAVLTLTKLENYTYTVTAKMGGTEVTVGIVDNTYTVAGVTGNVVFTVTRTVDITNAEATQYVQLNGTNMWLVKMPVITDKHYTYDGKALYSAYEKNVFLMVDAVNPVENSKLDATKLAIVDDDAPTLTDTMDINDSGKVDLNDAQLVWNMYNAVYSNFTEDVTMEKFLLADVNADEKLDVEDASDIVLSLN